MAKQVRGGPEVSSDEMWNMINAEFVLGETFGYGRDDTVIRKGEQRASCRAVCFKVIPTRSLQRRSDALREVEMLAAAKHKNVLESLGCFQSRSEVVIVTELCETDLLDKLNSNGRFSESDACLLFSDLVKALKHCHERGLAHRDIKLDNIFLMPDGTLKLGDFGFATQYKPNEILVNSCGTLSYAAPELLKPKGQVHCRPEAADVWSAGVVLYALVAGKLPFQGGDDDASLIAQIRSGYWSAPRNLSDPVRDLLRKMLNVEPTSRPSLADITKHKWVRESEEQARRRAGSWTLGMPAPALKPNPPTAMSMMCASDLKKQNFFKKRFLKLLVQS